MKIALAMADAAPGGYPAIYKKNIFEAAQKAHDMGYDGIEWHLRRPDAADIEKMQTLLQKLNMQVDGLGTGMACLYDGLMLMHPEKDVRKAAVARLREFTDMAAALSCMVVIGSIKGKIPPDADRNTYEGYLMEGLDQVLDYAAKRNVTYLLEALNRYETNILNTAEQTDVFIRKVRSPFLKTHIDTFHMNIEEADLYQSIMKCKETLGHVHFADSSRYYPGSGHIDFTKVAQGLKDAGYAGWIAVECLMQTDAEAEAKKAIDFIRKLI
jgi:sugar phosphate isomerase/epimerase